MDDPAGVGRSQRVRHLDANAENRGRIEGLSTDELFEGLPLQQFHGKEALPFVLTKFINGADVGVVQGRHSTGLAHKTIQRLDRWMDGKELQRHGSA